MDIIDALSSNFDTSNEDGREGAFKGKERYAFESFFCLDVLFRHYKWNVMSFGLKNVLSKFQNIMNDIFNYYTRFSIV